MNVAKLIQQQRHFHHRIADNGANAIRHAIVKRGGLAAGKRIRRWRRLAATIGLLAVLGMPGLSREAVAININFFYLPTWTEPSWDPGGNTLTVYANTVVAPYWEDILHGSDVVTIAISWDTSVGLGEGTATSISAGRPTAGRMAFNPDRLWWDDWEVDNSQYDMAQVLYRDLTGPTPTDWYNGNVPDLLEVSYRGTGNGASVTLMDGTNTTVDNCYDLFSSVIHETGHVLGLSHTSMARAETVGEGLPYDFDVPPVLVDGRSMAIMAAGTDPTNVNHWAHIAADALMCNACADHGLRRLPSATDVFAIMASADWDTGNVDLLRQDFFSGVSWNTPGNWEGNRVPGSADDASIRHGGNVSVNASDQVKNLFVGEHSSLDLNDYSMTVTNDTIVEHDGTGGLVPVIRVDPNGDLHTEDLRLFGGGLQLFGGNALVDDFVEITSQDRDGNQVGNGHIVGEGLVLVEGGLRNNGDLIAGYGGTLRFESPAATPWNLDGSGSEDGSVKAQAGNIEFGSGGLNDEFDGDMYVGDGVSAATRYISFAENWTLGDQGRLIMRGNSDNSYAHRGEITGNGLMTVRGEITAFNYSRIDTAVIFDDSAAVNISGADSSLRFAQGHLTVYNGGTFTGEGTLYQNSDAVVQNDSTVDFSVASLDLDGLSDATTFSIGSGAVVNLTGEHLADAFDGTLTMSGDSILNVSMTDDWRMRGQFTFNNGSGADVAGDSRIEVAGRMHVDEGWAQLHAESLFGNGSELQIDSDGHLVIWADTQFFNGAIVNVDGTLQVFGEIPFSGDATIGRVGNIEVYEPWTMSGNLTIEPPFSPVVTTVLEGSDVEFAGTVSVDGAMARIDAKVDITGTVDFFDGDARLHLDGGTTADPNTISGGTIDGGGTLVTEEGHALHGYGTINAAIEFAGDSNVFATGGTLRVNRTVRDVGRIGTASSDGVLDFGATFQSANADRLELNDGEVTGANLINNGLTIGYGRITTSNYSNSGTTTASGGTLEIDTSSSPDLDGGSENGIFNAIDGSIIVHTFGGAISRFNGTISIGDGQSFEIRGGDLSNETGGNPGEINFDGGTLTVLYFTNHGVLNTDTAPATLDSFSTFESGSLNTIDADLHIEGSATIQASSNWSGAAGVVVNTGSTLTLAGGDLGTVGVVNHGTFTGYGIAETLSNRGGGLMSPDAGQSLRFTGPDNTNSGTITLNSGTVEFDQNLTNHGDGVISGQGILRGAAGITSPGQFDFASGSSDVVGEVSLTNDTGRVDVATGGDVDFHDDFDHHGEAVDVDSGGRVVFLEDVTGPGDFTGPGEVHIEGEYRPGGSTASVSFAGDLYFGDASALVLELGGTLPGDGYDQLLIDGLLSTDGLVEVLLINDFTPSGGQTFDLLEFGSLIGDPTWQLADLPSGLTWLPSLTSESITITALFVSDFNGDGDVNGADFLRWQDNFGCVSGCERSEGDADGDGDVDGNDFLTWQRQFGLSAGGNLLPAGAVPEPSAGSLAACLMAVVLVRWGHTLPSVTGSTLRQTCS